MIGARCSILYAYSRIHCGLSHKLLGISSTSAHKWMGHGPRLVSGQDNFLQQVTSDHHIQLLAVYYWYCCKGYHMIVLRLRPFLHLRDMAATTQRLSLTVLKPSRSHPRAVFGGYSPGLASSIGRIVHK